MARLFTFIALLVVAVCAVDAWGSSYRPYRPRSRNCVVSYWSRWSSCGHNGAYPSYTSCQTRTRHVRVTPIGNGARCPALVDIRACSVRPISTCYWSGWSQCKYSFAYGRRIRTRVQYGTNGRRCTPFSESEECNEPNRRPIPPPRSIPPFLPTVRPPPRNNGKRRCRRGRRRSGSSGSSGSSNSSCSDDSSDDDDSHQPRRRSRSRSRSSSRKRKSGSSSSDSD
uniref:thrombospondin type-1 domain-containing protein 7A-like n=1 Tax=Ciona intestinalis TaxID=7719 RepID=UPI000EF54E33|nr:thrombospondin type-1 domain-containing protein 7A-like [Ciona intestinalis]|eukprot:XP_018670344.2 thrombospondin type-1 domain-containing protein 7A-like [Ciona intestinalis]